MKIAIIGAGWAGLAAAVEATQAGHAAVVFEASHTLGGRARSVQGEMLDGTPVTLDNGQHILIGAYRETLRLLQAVGVEPEAALLRRPMTLQFPDGAGLRFPDWPSPLDALGGILGARGWQLADKWSLLRLASHWHQSGFCCDAQLSVAQLCQAASRRAMTDLIEPLCVSALNTPADRASAQVFLRVMKDALFGAAASSHLLLPRVNLGELFPAAAARWLNQHGARLQRGIRVQSVLPAASQWQVEGQGFDAVIVATSASESVRMLDKSAQAAPELIANKIRCWTGTCRALQFEAIATVYACSDSAALSAPMLALRHNSEADPPAPAQFVFDRGQLGGPRGLLAFVVSASTGDRQTLQTQVLWQARQQLGQQLQAVQTIVEKRATFACTPGLQRPAPCIAPGLLACGDYVEGPYPATLEGAVRSGMAAVRLALEQTTEHAHQITGAA